MSAYDYDCLNKEITDKMELLSKAYYLGEDSNEPMLEPSKGVPVALLDAGFDVWIDGNRGTMYQRGHEDRNISEEEYWDFGVVE
jgi:hypothetical protein